MTSAGVIPLWRYMIFPAGLMAGCNLECQDDQEEPQYYMMNRRWPVCLHLLSALMNNMGRNPRIDPFNLNILKTSNGHGLHKILVKENTPASGY